MADPKDSPVSGYVTELNQGEGEPGFTRTGPLLDVQRLKDEYLYGIPLKAPLTGQEMSDQVLKNMIRKAVGDFETAVRIPLSPVRITDKFNFERADDIQFGTRQTTRWPVLKVEKFVALYPGRFDRVTLPDGSVESGEVPYPTSWVNFQGDSGVFAITPTSSTLAQGDTSFVATESFRAITLGAQKHWPNLWRLTYIAGFDHDKIPDAVNDLIGTMAALRVLSMVSPAAFPVNSYAVGIDGLSQSTANGGPTWLAQRIVDLKEDRERLVAQLRAHYGTDMMFTVV
jgi:hypothetical protein